MITKIVKEDFYIVYRHSVVKFHETWEDLIRVLYGLRLLESGKFFDKRTTYVYPNVILALDHIKL